MSARKTIDVREGIAAHQMLNRRFPAQPEPTFERTSYKRRPTTWAAFLVRAEKCLHLSEISHNTGVNINLAILGRNLGSHRGPSFTARTRGGIANAVARAAGELAAAVSIFARDLDKRLANQPPQVRLEMLAQSEHLAEAKPPKARTSRSCTVRCSTLSCARSE